MTRFRDPPDPAFRRLNRSVDFDRRLAPYDVRLSIAHAGGLERVGVLDSAEREAIVSGLERIAAEIESGEFGFADADEDVHMAIERRLIELVGPLGGKIHTARSRNDQVATDLALFVREEAESAAGLCAALMRRLLALADDHSDWRMPGYTHLQRAQPVYLGHHLLAYFWMLSRDLARFRAAAEAAGAMPLGSGALAGVDWELDRDRVAAELGFDRVAANSLDAVSSRDFALDFLHAASVCATHLSRLGSEIVIWSSAEFGFCEPAEEFSSGSSIMPQKKNPDAAELLRAKSPRVAAAAATLLGVMHALPLAYSKDLQEDKEPVFDAADTITVCLEAADGLLRGIRFDREALAAAAADDLPAATDVADLLVRKGMPFREAHGIVGSLVRLAVESSRGLADLKPEELAEHSELLGDDYYELFADGAWIESKVSPGGTASQRLAEQLGSARAELDRIGI